MDFFELAENRYSVRRFSDVPVSQECIDKILSAARMAPTAHNNQPQEIIVVNSEQGASLLEKCTVCHYNAPLAFIISYNSDKAWVREYDGKNSGDVDASIVATHMMMAAQELGIGSVWIMYFIPDAVKTEFELPENVIPVAILMMGYPEAEPSPNHLNRRDPAEYVTYR